MYAYKMVPIVNELTFNYDEQNRITRRIILSALLNTFVFDIETVPDVNAGRKLLDLSDLSDAEVAEAMMALRRQQTHGASDFIRLHLQRIVCISAVLRRGDQFKVWSLVEPTASEEDIIERFFTGL